MCAMQPKKLLIMNILDILKKYTDENHRLSQKEIEEILLNEYEMKTDRKTVKRNLMNLIEFGYDLEYSESLRVYKNKDGKDEKSYILSDFYLNREFSDSELRLLIDSVLFSKHIPYSQCKELVEKLEGLSNIYFKSKVKHICNLPDNQPSNSQLFYTIEILDEAISKGRQVSFTYNHFDIDKKLHPNTTSDGVQRKYIINPYQIVATNGRYYLICNYDKYDDVSNYRLDRITDIKLLDTPAKSKRKVKGIENGLDLPKHLAENLYMFSGESVVVKFIAKRYILNDVIDWFGKDIKFSDATDDEVTVTVKVNQIAMKMWALKYSRHIRVISPQSLVDKIKEDIKFAMKNYEG
ncbi:MAG: WYL domain-containing protein [Ruminococcus sp.]|nr:WYL domain-containing protein [Ruminococcus sp.]